MKEHRELLVYYYWSWVFLFSFAFILWETLTFFPLPSEYYGLTLIIVITGGITAFVANLPVKQHHRTLQHQGYILFKPKEFFIFVALDIVLVMGAFLVYSVLNPLIWLVAPMYYMYPIISFTAGYMVCTCTLKLYHVIQIKNTFQKRKQHLYWQKQQGVTKTYLVYAK